MMAGPTSLNVLLVCVKTWATLASHLNRAQLIEFCFLAAQYDGLAATIATLNIPMDYPD